MSYATDARETGLSPGLRHPPWGEGASGVTRAKIHSVNLEPIELCAGFARAVSREKMQLFGHPVQASSWFIAIRLLRLNVAILDAHALLSSGYGV